VDGVKNGPGRPVAKNPAGRAGRQRAIVDRHRGASAGRHAVPGTILGPMLEQMAVLTILPDQSIPLL